MPLPNPFRRLAAATSTVDDLSAELGRQDKMRLDAQNTLYDLGARRPALLVDGTDTALAKHDEAMAAARRTIEQAEARIAVVEPEWRLADERETAARLDRDRRERHAAAVKARAEGVKLLAVYRAQAPVLADTLRRLAEIEVQIAGANLDLPPDAAPVGLPEPFNGRHPTRDITPTFEVWVAPNGAHIGHVSAIAEPPVAGAKRKMVQGYGSIPGAPGIPHRSLLDRVALPAVDLNAAAYWSGRLAGGPTLSDDAAAFLRFHGVSS